VLKKLLIVALYIFIAFFLYNILVGLNYSEILQIISKIRTDFILAILFFNFIAFIFYMLAWHVLVAEFSKVSLKDNFIATLLCLFGNIVIPSASLIGEIFRVNYIKNKYSISYHELTAIALYNRFQYSLTMLIFFSIGFILMSIIGISSFIIFSSLVLIILLTLIFIIIIIKPLIFKKIAYKLSFILIKRNKNFKEYDTIYETKISRFIDNFIISLKKLKNSKFSWIAFVAMSLQWFFNSLAIYVSFLALGYYPNFGIIVFTYPIFAMLTVTPIGTPANIGLIESSMIGLYISFGINITYAVTATFLVRSLIIIQDILISFPAFVKFRKFISFKT